MPVAHFHLVDGAYSSEQHRDLLTAASHCYSEVLDSPIDRVRVSIVRYRPDDTAVAGNVVGAGAPPAPYFTAIVLAGRPARQRQELAARFTDLIVDILGTKRSLVRGQVVEVAPENWTIAGTAAATVRAEEISGRAGYVPNE